MGNWVKTEKKNEFTIATIGIDAEQWQKNKRPNETKIVHNDLVEQLSCSYHPNGQGGYCNFIATVTQQIARFGEYRRHFAGG